jgi:predicted CXXCH cytochrome family protein
MRKARSDSGRARLRFVLLVLCLLGPASALTVSAQTASDIANTKHNLSVTGPGEARASTETRICIFCHTPHNAAPASPLWNKELEPRVYTVYTSPTLRAGLLPQPFGPTKLCLSCHDGMIAMGAVIDPYGGIAMSGGNTLPQQSLSNFGLDLSGHHPVSFPYHTALPNEELAASPPAELPYGEVDEIHCITCHDPHNDTYGRFLVKDNRYSALCTTCHQIPGWPGSAHATSPLSVSDTLLPRPPKTWPQYATLGEWGCEACHTPHFAPTADRLLNFTAGPEPFSCTTTGCHASSPGAPHLVGANGAKGDRTDGGAADIGRQVRKISAHHEVPGQVATTLRRGSSTRSGFPGVGCADCHNPHVGTSQSAEAPYVSGLLRGVRGIDRNGGIVAAATYEYEVCFKCHADNSPNLEYVHRVVPGTNMRLAFAVENPSYHPVVGAGKAVTVPSIPASFEPSMTTSQQIYCTACHADDEGGSRGPHGSSFRPILKARYETADFTPESFDNYALCYRCHDQASILRDDSFKTKTLRTTPSGGGHSGHLKAGIPCSACHDPHGVADNGASGTGSHTHLINFDVRIVLPKAGSTTPVFNDTGTFSGSCTLLCHGVAHDNASYP